MTDYQWAYVLSPKRAQGLVDAGFDLRVIDDDVVWLSPWGAVLIIVPGAMLKVESTWIIDDTCELNP